MKILWAVILCLVVVGGGFMIAGAALGANMHISAGADGVHAVGRDESTQSTVVDDMNIQPYTNIAIFLSANDIEFIQADAFGLQITADSGRNIVWSDEGGTLSIKDNTAGGWNWFSFNINFYDFFTGFNSTPIKVYIPADAHFDTAVIKTASGGVTIPQLNSDLLNVAVTSGGMNLGNITSSNLTLSLASGNLIMNAARTDTLSVNILSGTTNISGLTANSLSLSSASGNVTVSGSISDQINVSVLSGGIRLNLAGSQSDWIKTIHALSGGIRLDGVSIGNMAETGGGNTLNVKSTSGNINIVFEG